MPHEQHETPKPTCGDCGVEAGEFHLTGCDIERCAYCGRQAIGCECTEAEVNSVPRLPWTGVWPGEAECVEWGWFASFVPGAGWARCLPTDPGAGPDLNRLYADAAWDRQLRRWVKAKPD